MLSVGGVCVREMFLPVYGFYACTYTRIRPQDHTPHPTAQVEEGPYLVRFKKSGVGFTITLDIPKSCLVLNATLVAGLFGRLSDEM